DERAFWERVIGKGKQGDGDLEHALDLLANHGAMDQTRAVSLDHAARAKAALNALPDHPIKDMLVDLADYVVARVS
ncbi:MAG: polyprenyl synthetase family protein, partial [Pseudomonadota bacterium]